ncbi:MAG: glycoside hydrolase [Gammaproteobacteria bacterium]|nr:glycoside hydrolase [Gammaproteobacteria bacterium]
MHQPQYRNAISGEYCLPWTYLHSIKDYVDMVAHLEAQPAAKAVVNFVPILLEQIDDYAIQVKQFLADGSPIRDPLLAALATSAPTDAPIDEESRLSIMTACLRAHEERFINRFPAYRRLADMANVFSKDSQMLHYVDEQFLIDLLVWYHVAWIGETVRRTDERITALIKKEIKYDDNDRHILMSVISELLSGVIGRYKLLAESGQIELSMTPYAHPIVPLLLDINSAAEAMPDVVLPELDQYPGGEERARWHILKGIETFRRYFGITPVGCWPSEGSVSTETIKILSEHGFQWTASGENVFRNSLDKVENARNQDENTDVDAEANESKENNLLYHPYRIGDSQAACFFRDDGLSDLIGFTYSTWHADDAVANLISHLENIAASIQDESDGDGVVSIILDGENAWEHYPENGYYFLNALYDRLSEHPLLDLTTFTQCLADGSSVRHLSELVAGSWVYGTFSTWIGDRDKNRGWDMLGDAKRAFDRVISTQRLSGEQLTQAETQLAICEGSDWFWWFGDYNPKDSVSDFEFLYRQHLTHLYNLIGENPPDYLSRVFTHGGGTPQTGGVMRPGSE